MTPVLPLHVILRSHLSLGPRAKAYSARVKAKGLGTRARVWARDMARLLLLLLLLSQLVV